MIANNEAPQRAVTTALVIRRSAATERRRTDEGHLSQERAPMSQLPISSETLAQVRIKARLAAVVHARAAQLLANLRQLATDLAENAQTEGVAAHVFETLAREVSIALPCQHLARSLRYLGLHQWTGGPELVHAAECSRSCGGCGQLIVLNRDGGARAVGVGSRFMTSRIAG